MEFGNLNFVFAPNQKGKTLLYETLEIMMGTGDNPSLIRGHHQVLSVFAEIEHDSNVYDVGYFSKSKEYLMDNKAMSQKDYVKNYTEKLFGSEHILTKKKDNNNYEIEHNINCKQKLALSFFPETRVGDLNYPFPKAVANTKKSYRLDKVLQQVIGEMDNRYYSSKFFIESYSKKSLDKEKALLKKQLNGTDLSQYDERKANELRNLIFEIEDLKKIKKSLSNNRSENKLEILCLLEKKLKEVNHQDLESEISKIIEAIKNVEYEILERKSYMHKLKNYLSEKEKELEEKIGDYNLSSNIKYAKHLQAKERLDEINKVSDGSELEVKLKDCQNIVQTAEEKLAQGVRAIEAIMKKYFSRSEISYLRELSKQVDQKDGKFLGFKIDIKNDFSIKTFMKNNSKEFFYDCGSQALKTLIQVTYILSLHEYMNTFGKNDYPFVVFDSISMPFSTLDESVYHFDNLHFKELKRIIQSFSSNSVNIDSQIIIIDDTVEWVKNDRKMFDKFHDLSNGLIIPQVDNFLTL